MKFIKVIGLIAVFGSLFFAHNGVPRAGFVAEEVAKKVQNSVGTIETISVGYAALGLGGMPREFGGEERVVPVEVASLRQLVRSFATFFVVSKDGYALSSASQLRGADAIEATLVDGSKCQAEIVVLDEGWDVALVRLVNPPKSIQPVKFGNSDLVKQGDSVVVVGAGGGFGNTVSYGIVSARRGVRLASGQLVPDMIQSDVVVNVGNQGSPLFNDKGEVIGMHVIFAGGGTAMRGLQNVSFFVPSNLLKRIYPELIKKKGPAFRPWLGIRPFSGAPTWRGGIAEVNDALKMYLNLPDEYWDVGVLIADVWDGSPAFDGGLRRTDFLVKLNGKLLKSIGQLEEAVYNAKEGERFVFGLIRNNTYREVEVKIGNHPKETLRYYF